MLASRSMTLRTAVCAPGDGPLAAMINDEELSVSKEDHTLQVWSFPKLKNADFRTNSFSVWFPYIQNMLHWATEALD